VTAQTIEERYAAFADLLPTITELNETFHAGLSAGEFRLQHCSACDANQYPGEAFCYECGSTDVAWQAASGEGSVYSFIVVHQPYHPAFQPFLPYPVAVVQLDAGPRMLGAMLDVEEPIAIGDRVRARIVPISEERSGLFFEPATD
jgi:uncharacterized OB-fold protein